MKNIFMSALGAIAIFSATTINAQNNIAIKKTAPKTDINGTADDLKDTGVIGVGSWSEFNKLSKMMYTLKGASYFTTIKMMRAMEPTALKLRATMPTWLKSDEVKEDIADFVKDYTELVTSTSADDDEFRENLEEIVEQYEDLREEVQEQFNAYVVNVSSANEEYKEEIESSRSKKVNMKDGYEEYKEEISDLEDLSDGDKMTKKEMKRLRKAKRKLERKNRKDNK